MAYSQPPCQRCGSTSVARTWSVFGDGSRHIREQCADCLRFVRWAPQTQEHIAEADRTIVRVCAGKVDVLRSSGQRCLDLL